MGTARKCTGTPAYNTQSITHPQSSTKKYDNSAKDGYDIFIPIHHD